MATLRTRAYYLKEYVELGRSPADIATEHGTYPSKIRRELQKFKIKLRDKSAAQKNAISKGRHLHPTKGKKRDVEVRHKISASMAKAWDDMDDAERQRRIEISRTQWNEMSDSKKTEFKRLAAKAVRDAGEFGSKLEQFVRDKLVPLGFKIEFHATVHEHKVDIYLPNEKIAIDIHGPTHFLPIWGEDYLLKRQEEDSQKIKCLIDEGVVFIRVIHAAKTIAEVDKNMLVIRLLCFIADPPKKKKERLVQLEIN